ncbi:CHAP domain-containing protein [Labedaea rhizosphaerae]|uniref:CHAP domain-containing protein n=1 Tax=Labedaea rhizosphaerae TaxID=598644 RepID=UPI00105C9604
MTRRRIASALAATAAAIGLAVLPAGVAAASPAPVNGVVAGNVLSSTVSPRSAGDGTAAGAIQWMQAHTGSSGWEGYCEMAVENAWGTTGVWPSAIDHWYGAVQYGKAHSGDPYPPAGAFVYWNISQYGHVGIADGYGGFYSSSIGGAIGHADSVYYFANYLGWSNPQVPA